MSEMGVEMINQLSAILKKKKKKKKTFSNADHYSPDFLITFFQSSSLKIGGPS